MAFRPTIARGLALSAMLSFFRLSPPDAAISVPKESDFSNWLIFEEQLGFRDYLGRQDCDVFRRKRGLFADSFADEPSALAD